MLSALLIFIFLSPLSFFLFSSLSLSLSLSVSRARHFSTSTNICWVLKRPAGQTDAVLDQSGKSNLGRLIQASTDMRVRADTSRILTNTHTPPLLHSGLPASTLIDLHLLYQMDFSLLLSSSTPFLSVWLRIINVPDHAQDVYVSNFSFNFGSTSPPPFFFLFCDVSVFQGDRCSFPTHSLTAPG